MRRLIILALCCVAVVRASNVTTCQYDNTRQGGTTTETVLTPANVKVGSFGKLGSWVLDGPIYACPLYVSGTIYVATMANSVYALDAAHPGSTSIWHINFGTPVPAFVWDGTFTTNPGILGGPVIDAGSGWMFLVSLTNEAGTSTYTMRKIRISDGNVLASRVISGSVTGTGQAYGCCADDTTGPLLNFHAGGGATGGSVGGWQLQHTPLLLLNGHIFFTFGSINEFHTPWHGWAFRAEESDLSITHVWACSPNSYGCGI
jgi:hypothetical protein